MNRPYIICHMVTSIDGKVTGDFLNRPGCEAVTEEGSLVLHYRSKAGKSEQTAM